MSSSEDDPVAWLRRRIRERLYLARHAIELGNAAEWYEQSSGVLVTGEPTETDVWHGTWAMGDSSLSRLMEANDPRDTIARCEAELAIIEAHDRAEHYCPIPVLPGRHSQLWTPEEGLCWTLRLLVSGYRTRPGYREEWGP